MIVFGDVHGNFANIKYNIKMKNLSDTDLFMLGDFGVGFIERNQDIKNIENLNTFLKEKNLILWTLRGNHDNPIFFNGDYILSNLKLMPDYSVVDIVEIDIEGNEHNHKILMVGGAISIDRRYRLSLMQKNAIMGRDIESYWFDENFILDEDKLKLYTGITKVITHTAPEFCYPDNNTYGFSQIVHEFAKDDPKLYNELNKERSDLTKMYDILMINNNITSWGYGHFHNDKVTDYNGTKFHLVGIGNIKDI